MFKKKEKESRICEKCKTKKKHQGYNTKKIHSALGDVPVKRVYWACVPCKLPEHPADGPLGLENNYSIGARRLAVFAGTNWSFDKSAEYLKEFCGIKISDNTIRELCQQESPKMKEWQNNDTAAHTPFRKAGGEIEFTTDGTMVPTLDGWREFRIGIYAKRESGKPATPLQWGTRQLPKPHVSVAFTGIYEKDVFRTEWGYWLNRLDIKDTSLVSVLADGARWIWDSSFLEFGGKAQENLDIYHALEYLAEKSNLLYGKDTPERNIWFETMRSDLLAGGSHALLERVRLHQSVEQLDSRLETLRVLENYLVEHQNRMNYRERLWSGLSIGSGQVEGACKNLVGRRLKQTGACWEVGRVNRMGVLCAVLYGDQWKDYWKTAV